VLGSEKLKDFAPGEGVAAGEKERYEALLGAAKKPT
jgi:hypothetical protein